MISLRTFIFCFRESTAICAGESIAQFAGACQSDKTYLFFIDFRCGDIRLPDWMLLKPPGFSGKPSSDSGLPRCNPALRVSHKFFFRLAQHIVDCWRRAGSG
ncbi:hypothetical protein [Burkholderia sp. S-53]|uniref:hypothetical protein n=1 Tax=Burkholderia sp. S-53 TaxID=2906514 RepID=UPI0021CF64B2|nr:hypothetical protein [Burkholderia sp. S-53]UXU85958.1 hypothetical protein LXM88_01350 [Burkholderia sp. S-53]